MSALSLQVVFIAWSFSKAFDLTGSFHCLGGFGLVHQGVKFKDPFSINLGALLKDPFKGLRNKTWTGPTDARIWIEGRSEVLDFMFGVYTYRA